MPTNNSAIDDRNVPVWFITGCSAGFGLEMAKQVLARGWRAVLTARKPKTLAEVAAPHADRALTLGLDVTKLDQIKAAVTEAEARFGRIDVLVNNAGYGYLAAIEEGEEEGVRELFDTNVFGAWHMIKEVLPGMRAHKSGHIVNMSSIGGLTTFPAVGFYHMAKFALEGLSETLAKEVAPFGIGVTVVEPGAFRTNFRGQSMKQSPVRLPVYAATTGAARDKVLAGDGKQENDPVLGAKAIIAAAEADRPPLHLLLGNDALEQARQKVADLTRDFDAWEELTRSTKFEEKSDA